LKTWIRKSRRDGASYREKKILGKLEKAEAADFKVATQAGRSSKINAARDHIPTSFSFSFAGGDRSQKIDSLSTIY
jgi:hypothetical protein